MLSVLKGWIEAVYRDSKLKGIAVLFGLAILAVIVLAGLLYLFGVDVGGYVNGRLGL